MIRGLITFAATAFLLAATQAHAGLTLCNRTSYRVQAAIGVEKRANVATRGWFQIDPGDCKLVLDGTLDADMIYLHARTPPLYGSAPMPQSGQAELCVREQDFDFADGRGCPVTQQARFSAAQPSEQPNGPTVNLAEEAGYDDAQARLAGMQRLLAIAGYDAYPIDGVPGSKTQAALAKFIADRKLPADAVTQPKFFDTLIEAANNPAGAGFAWCNDTKYTVMAALGVVEMGAVVTRGWYRVDAGKCVKPDVAAKPARLYSFGEAVDKEGQSLKRGDKLLTWGGPMQLCTRDVRFEISEQKDCGAQGLTATGFAVIDMAGKQGATVRFRE